MLIVLFSYIQRKDMCRFLCVFTIPIANYLTEKSEITDCL